MLTSRIISNVAYNSVQFFEHVIENLEKRNVIDWAYWIHHDADKDDDKEHIHFVLKPTKRLDTKELRTMFFERDPNNEKPLACTTKWFYTNSMDDWLLYAVHDEYYLASKNQFRNFHYEFKDLRATDYDALKIDWASIDRTKFERLHFLYDAVQKSIPFVTLVQQGVIPIAQRAQYENQYKDLCKLVFKANAERREPHVDFVDEDGVVETITGFELDNQMEVEF